MRLGLYTFAALAFAGLVAGFVYTLAPGNYVLETPIPGMPNLNLPVALWVVLPLLLLILLTILHLLYHGTRNYFARRKWQRDIDTMQDAMYWSLIGEPKEHNYSIPQVSEGASILTNSSLNLAGMPKGISSKLTKTVEWIKQIEDGEYVDLKKSKVERFMSKDNLLLTKNQLNRLDKEPDFADEVLRSRESYSQSIVDAGLRAALEHQTFFKLKKYANLLSFEDITVLLDRADAGEDVGFTQDTMESCIEGKDLSCSQYLRLVSSTIEAFDPDQNLAYFKKLAKEKSNAQSAYLFLLFRYEMVEKAERYLDEHDDNDFVAFRAFLALKKSKYNYKVRDFIVASNACK
jgi:hypothetical protein